MLTTLSPPCAVVMKSGNLNFLESSDCFTFTFYETSIVFDAYLLYIYIYMHNYTYICILMHVYICVCMYVYVSLNLYHSTV
jgi:hypothetical protein